MKIIVTHASPDLDGITSIWLIKKFLPGWENAKIQFVPAGEKYNSSKFKVLASRRSGQSSKLDNPIEKTGENEVIHVDTGMGPLDHHQTSDMNVAAASLTFDFVKRVQSSKFSPRGEAGKVQSVDEERQKDREEAIGRIVKLAVDIDHFQEVFWDNPTADFHEFSLIGIIEGLKFQKPDQDEYYIDFVSDCLDALLHDFENRIWAEKEIKEKGIEFETNWGNGLAIESINDTVIKLAQKMGYAIVVRKDPRKGYIRVKARPLRKYQISPIRQVFDSEIAQTRGAQGKYQKEDNIDLTLLYEKLRKMDPEATWYLHVSKKMLLNGTIKNPKMKPTNLSLDDIVKVLEDISQNAKVKMQNHK